MIENSSSLEGVWDPSLSHYTQLDIRAGYPSPITSTFDDGICRDGFQQISSSVGPDRVMTRRQRAALEKNNPERIPPEVIYYLHDISLLKPFHSQRLLAFQLKLLLQVHLTNDTGRCRLFHC